MKKLVLGLATLALVAVSTASANAHVNIDPKVSAVGRQTYDIRVPNEKDVATFKFRVVVPDGVEVSGVQPVPGWTHTEKKVAVAAAQTSSDDDEVATARITEITWDGGTIQPGEYQVFSIATNYTGDPKDLTWKSYQTYAGGQVVSWDDSSASTPAPRVTVTKDTATVTLQKSVESAQQKQNEFKPDANTWLAGAALAVAIAALLIGLHRRTG